MSTPLAPSDLSPAVSSRASQTVLAVLACLALLVLLYRGYGHSLRGHPTQLDPAAVRYAVNLNTADKAELMQVPGVGPNLADAILSHRQLHGRFTAVEELMAVPGIGNAALETARPWVRVQAPTQWPPEPVPELVKLERRARETPTPYAVRQPHKIQPGEPPIDIDTAEVLDLQRLPGIGPVLAQRIVDSRARERFQSVDDLRRVKGIGAKTLSHLRAYVVCRSSQSIAVAER
ncbi:MAG: helix-hairpin-helix domain-containing protein [Bacteroidales bacterium]|nr:helix-hairpin-helix domain-containing protein [Bacteroidales bacterium]